MRDQRERFRLVRFKNPSGKIAWRVSGVKRDGFRIRENFGDRELANSRRLELEAEFWEKVGPKLPITTGLSREQIEIAERVFALADDPADVAKAFAYWQENGKPRAAVELSLEDAVNGWLAYLDNPNTPKRNRPGVLSENTKEPLRFHARKFSDRVGRVRLANVSPEMIEKYIHGKGTSDYDQHATKRALDRFFGWCMARPQRWIHKNPVREAEVVRPVAATPKLLSVAESEALLRCAEKIDGGVCVPSLAVALFAGLRPEEVAQLTWDRVQLAEKKIVVTAESSKVRKRRVVTMTDNLVAWLKGREGVLFNPSRTSLAKVRIAAGFLGGIGKYDRAANGGLKPWVHDVLRHTGASHVIGRLGRYADAAKELGNSEAMLVKHYEGAVTSEETKAFFSLLPLAQ